MGADLDGANLGSLALSKNITIQSVQEAAEIAEDLFWCWETKGLETTKSLFQAYQIPGEERALIIFHPNFQSGWCYVLKMKQIWIWNWSCPDPKTVPIVWDESWR